MTAWFDTHAHLNDAKFDEDRGAVIAAAFEAGVTGLIEIADGPDDWDKSRAIAEENRGRIWFAGGLHPYYAEQSAPELWSRLRDAATHPQFVAVGEIGLDYAKSGLPPDRQETAFRDGLELAGAVGKPVIVHCREAYPDLHHILRSYFSPGGAGPSPGVVHCFSGSAADAEKLLELGFYLGVDGPVGYPSAKALREALAAIPLDRLVVETDSPYLPPQEHRGQRNEPRYLPLIGKALAAARSVSVETVKGHAAENARRLFRLPPS